MKAFPGNRFEGMELRDYFAAVALSVSCGCSNPKEAAKEAYEYADAMMEERKNDGLLTKS
jgi:hypothetical protein